MVRDTEAISLYSDIDSCSFTTPARQLTCKALYEVFMIYSTTCALWFFLINIDTSMQNWFTPLIGACMTGQADIAKLLLEHKATVDYQSEVICSMSEAAVGLLGIVLSCYLL